MSTQLTHQRPRILAIWLTVAGIVGWIAAFVLTLERLHLLEHPTEAASCDFSVIVQCTENIKSWQGSVFGFPNPLLGLAAWVAPIVVGVAILAGARFARWFWLLFWAGFLFAFCFVIWLMTQSIFSIATLCIWCITTWVVTIPSFYALTLHLLRSGVVPLSDRGQQRADALMSWVPVMAIASYVVVGVIAQVRLDWISTL